MSMYVLHGARERVREKQRQREGGREGERQTGRQTDRQTDRARERARARALEQYYIACTASTCPSLTLAHLFLLKTRSRRAVEFVLITRRQSR